MKKKTIARTASLLLFFSIAFVGVKVEAFSPVNKMPGINIVNTTTMLPDTGKIIPEEFANVLRVSSEMSYTVVGADSWKQGDYANFKRPNIEADPNKKRYVQINKIGIYQGKYFDLRINIDKITNPKNKESGEIRIHTPMTKSPEFLFIWTRQTIEGATTSINYQFLDRETQKPIDYQGMWNFRRINIWKGIEMDNDPNYLYGTYAYDINKLKYEENLSNKTMYVIGDKNGTDETLNSYFTTLFKTRDGSYYQTYDLTNGSQAKVKYDSQPITKTEMPTPELIGDVHEDYPKISYSMYQDVPEQVKSTFYPNNFKLTMKLDENVNMDDLSVKINKVQDPNENVDKYFTVVPNKAKNQIEIYIPNSSYNNANFIDSSYRFKVETSVKTDKDLSKYYKEGYYHMPASAYYSTSEKPSSIVQYADSLTRAVIDASPITQTVARGSDTDGWDKKQITELFSNIKGAYPEDTLKIKSVENKTFNPAGNADTVKVTLVGTKTGIEKTFTVPVVVLNARKANLNYVDLKGTKISNPVVKQGFETKKYDFTNENKQIANYKFVKVDDSGKYDPVTGTFPSADKELNIYFVYELDQHPVTIQYLDVKNDNRSILDNKIEEVKVGDKHKVKAEKVPGYKLVSATVNDEEVKVTNNEIEFEMPTKPAVVKFNYEPNHMDVSIVADKNSATQTEKLAVTTKIDSLMTYDTGQKVQDYADDFLITIHTKKANVSAEKPTDIKLVTSGKTDVTGEVVAFEDYFTVKLKKGTKLPDTESLTMTFNTTVKMDAVTDSLIEYGAEVRNTYKLNTSKVNDSYESIVKTKKDSNTKVSGSLRLVEGPAEIDFGKIDYLAKNQRVEDPTIKGKLEVADTRHGAKKWTLQATMEEPLKDGTKVLPSEVKYKTDTEDLTLTSAAKPVYENTQQTNRVVVSDSWGTKPGSNGVKLNVKSTDKLTKGTYIGKIRWTVVEAE